MKKIHDSIQLIGLFLAMLVFFAMPGCQELNFKNPNGPTTDNPPNVQLLVTGSEAGMRIDLAIYLRAVSIFGREAYYFEPADPRYTGELVNGQIDPGGFLVTRPWGARYRVVKNCVTILESPGADAGATAFANTIIAHQLLMNLNYTGQNGIKIVFSDDINTPFVSEEEALAEITRRLDAARDGLNSLISANDTLFSFNLSPGFAGFDTPETFLQFNRALRARVAVYQEDWNTALQALQQSFLSEGGSMELGVYHVYSNSSGDQSNEIYEEPAASFVKFNAHQTFLDEAEPGDTRAASRVFVRSDPTTFDGLTTTETVALLASSIDRFPVIRNEELILLRAEARIQTDDFAGAESDINAVRSANGLAGITLPTDKTEALFRLLYERRYSLAFEGHRWIDLRRYNDDLQVNNVGVLDALPRDRTGDQIVHMIPRPESETGG